MTDTPPDRLASHPKSPFYDAALLERVRATPKP